MRWDKWLEGLAASILAGIGLSGSGWLASFATGRPVDYHELIPVIGTASLGAFFYWLKDHKIKFSDDVVDPAAPKDK